MNHSALFQSQQINQLLLPNRLAVAPMTRVSASADGVAGERMRQYYQRFAQGEFGLIVSEGIYIDQAWSQSYEFQSGLVNEAQQRGWRQVTQAVHQHGGRIFAQLQHAGALSQGNRYRTQTVAPSALRPKGEQMTFYRGEGRYPLPRALEDGEIQQIIADFAAAAERALHAGFDGIEIHGANGYLLDQFFTAYSNQRDDRWGGDIIGRLSLSLAVIDAVRQRIGRAVPLGIRLSQGKVNDFDHKWDEGEAGAKSVFQRLATSGIDFLHVTEHEAWQPAFDAAGESLAALAHRHAPSLTLIANGGLHQPQRALQLTEQGADVIALGRGALANPDWPRRVRQGLALQAFDRALLGPIADIKASELRLASGDVPVAVRPTASL
ncbi:tRNA-dihydrouridine synthase [Serratia rubidaea]|uniref:NADH oxidase n=1 Tax=Serratia rubidaea TaxID=61652 RepID=A0A3S4YWP1_SERRU|nr:NADH:flavin oxidoreductase [Serratia rubidaea]MBH1929216.1 NADH:flavin oxidoreductase [Serratia rubidaea]MDC6119045.1 NADH:flavin oxidoreductase [Serratia rubidaea]MEB7585069.1 NADH:flavin oxidoreductase [Serratia rubidaea]VEI70106.1 NADH oxidase [Serratia rubidaea]